MNLTILLALTLSAITIWVNLAVVPGLRRERDTYRARWIEAERRALLAERTGRP